ncbi:MAG: hypothetical protein ACRCWR_08175 [Saezia sp.]
MSVEVREYSLPQSKKIFIAVASFVVLFILNIFMVIAFGRGLSLAGCIGIAVAMYLTSGIKIKLTSDRLSVKPFVGKAKEYLFKDGTFSIEEATGVKAFCLTFSSKAPILYYTPNGSNNKQTVSFMLTANDIHSIFQQIKAAR